MAMRTPDTGPKVRFWRRSLVARLVFYFLVLSVMTVTLLGTISFLQAKRALERSVLGRLEVAAALKKDALTQWLEEQRNEFLLLGELKRIGASAADLLRRPRSDPRFAAAHAAIAEVVTPLVARKRGWQEIFVLSEKGEILLSTDAGHEGDHRILDRYFVEGKKGFYVEKVYLSPVTFQPTMTLSMPFGGEEPGVIAVNLDLVETNRIIVQRKGLGEKSESYLVDRFNVPISGGEFVPKARRRGLHSPGIMRALAFEDGEGLYENYAGTPVIGVFRWIGDLDVALLIEIPQEVAFAPARQILFLVVAVGFAIAVSLALGTYLLARQIAGPVLRIASAAVRVAKGDLKTRAPVLTEDEIGTLAKTFNRMTEALEKEIAERLRIERQREALIEELEARNEELGRFTYTVSHDLKSPLVTIRGFLGLLEKDAEAGDAERMAQDIGHIRGATETMRQILEDLLELSRVGRQLNPTEDVALSDLVRQALESVAGSFTARGVEVAVETGKVAVRGDRIRLLEVFQNLLANAAAFMGDEPRPRVEIGARPAAAADCPPGEPPTQEGGDKVLCRVGDNGIGIDPRHHKRVFNLFERLDPSTKGTGIGLALVKRIVELHGGNIWIESPGVAGKGTTFYFTLPAATGGALRRSFTGGDRRAGFAEPAA